MKIKCFVWVLLSILSVAAFGQQKKIALLEPRIGDGSTGVSGMEKAMVRGELRKAIVNHTGYEAFTRADIDKLMSEQDFQRTGMVSDDQIKRIGVMSGADYICVSTLNKTNTEFYLEAYLVNVESAQISNPASQYGELVGGKLANMLPVCQALAQELLGTISPAVRSIKATETSSSKQNKTIVQSLFGGGSAEEKNEPSPLPASTNVTQAQIDAYQLSTLPDGTVVVVNRSDEDIRMSYDDAVAACACKGAGWRLPTIQELRIIEKRKNRISDLSTSWRYWAIDGGTTIDMSSGAAIKTKHSVKAKVRCVKEEKK